MAERITIESVEVRDDTIAVRYRVDNMPAIELTIVVRGADPARLSRDTIAKLVLLAELMEELAADIEYENDPVEHGNIHPLGWTAMRFTDEMGGNTLVVEHRVYESNE